MGRSVRRINITKNKLKRQNTIEHFPLPALFLRIRRKREETETYTNEPTNFQILRLNAQINLVIYILGSCRRIFIFFKFHFFPMFAVVVNFTTIISVA